MTACPSDEQFSDLLADALTTAERDALARHVEGCAPCRDKLGRLAGTPETETWRRVEQPTRGSYAEERVVWRLKQMRPPSENAGPDDTASPAGHLPHTEDVTPVGVGPEWPAVPGYEILGELGRGGMSVVYKARQLALQRTVAVKMVLTGAHVGPKDLARFRAEAEVIARLQHPNIVQIYDVGEAAGRPYFVLEFVAGGSLAQHLHGRPQPARPAARLVETL